MKCIIGLGNPWVQYEHTRHNIGFIMIDRIQEEWNFPSWKPSRFLGLMSEWVKNGEKIVLLKPQTYMNASGESVSKIVTFYKLDITHDILIISDDIDMVFGKVRFRKKWSSGGQKGLNSIREHLGTDEFMRIKVGIGRNPLYSVSDWVLSKFTEEEFIRIYSLSYKQVYENIGNILK